MSDELWKRDRYIKLTLDPVDSVGLQRFISQLKDLPQIWGYPAQLESRAVDEFVHVVKQVCHTIKSLTSLAASDARNYR